MPRRGPNVQAARKVCAYEGWQQNLSWQDIQKEDRIKFGTQHRKLSRTSIKRYVSNGEKLRNAAYVKPKIYKAPHRKTMTVPQKRFMTQALLAVCTTSIVRQNLVIRVMGQCYGPRKIFLLAFLILIFVRYVHILGKTLCSGPGRWPGRHAHGSTGLAPRHHVRCP